MNFSTKPSPATSTIVFPGQKKSRLKRVLSTTYMIFKRNKSAQPLKATTKFTTNCSKEVRLESSSETRFSSQ